MIGLVSYTGHGNYFIKKKKLNLSFIDTKIMLNSTRARPK